MHQLFVVVVALLAGVCIASSSQPMPQLPEIDDSLLHELSLTVANGLTDPRNTRLTGLLCENVTNNGWSPAPAGQAVDLRIGSGGDGYGCANFNPGVQAPFGCMRIGPDTSIDWLRIPWRHGGGYSWCDTHVRGFSHTHMVAPGVDDLGNIGFMPITGPLTTEQVTCFNPLAKIDAGVDIRICNYRQRHHHATETVSPAYYSTVLYDPDHTNITIQAEFTATPHAAYHRYTWSCPSGQVCTDWETARRILLINVCHMVSYSTQNCVAGSVTIDVETSTVSGMVHNNADYSRRFGGFDLFFVARFDVDLSPINPDPVNSGTWIGQPNGQLMPGSLSIANLTTDGGGYIDFGGVGGANSGGSVNVRLGMSFISYEVAAQNLEAEIPDTKPFAGVVNETNAAWDHNIFDLVTINTPSEQQSENGLKLRTALYHATMAPTNFTEYGGLYMGFDKTVHQTSGQFVFMTDMSIWDIMRTQFPLLAFLLPETAFNVMASMVTVANQVNTGWLPKWILANGETNGMEACHSVVMLMDGILSGIIDDPNGLLDKTDILMKMNYTLRSRQGTEYIARGYNTNSPCETQEYALDDFCTAELAKQIGTFPDLVESFTATSKYWQNVWDNTTQFFCPRNSSGGWEECRTPLWPEEQLFVFDNHYTEGDAWHWRWFAPHAMPDLVERLGGAEQFSAIYDGFMYNSRTQVSNFLPNPWYWSGNEPDIQVPVLAHYSGRPDLVQKYMRWIMDNKYTIYPDGIPGNDDYGTMSAWFVWSALGLYPMSCQGMFAIGSPLFSDVTVNRPQWGNSVPANQLTIKAYNNSASNIYVTKVVLNGEAVTSGFVTAAQLNNGGAPTSLLEFWMTDVPTKYY